MRLIASSCSGRICISICASESPSSANPDYQFDSLSRGGGWPYPLLVSHSQLSVGRAFGSYFLVEFFEPPFMILRAVEKRSGFGSEAGAHCTAPTSQGQSFVCHHANRPRIDPTRANGACMAKPARVATHRCVPIHGHSVRF